MTRKYLGEKRFDPVVTIALERDATRHAQAIRNLLKRTDHEFHPPLSHRDGPTQTSDLTPDAAGSLDEYLRDLLDQPVLLVVDGAALRGVLAFKSGYETPELAGYTPATYVSTLVVDPDSRREGHARRLYHALFEAVPAGTLDSFVATRTWSENEGHLGLLDELGFERVWTLPDDRGDEIYTVYYAIAVGDFEPVI